VSSRNTSTGAVLEDTILPCLKRNGYQSKSQVFVGYKPNGKLHRVDVLATNPKQEEILVSLKWQQVGGTAEEKLPFEVIKLIYSIKNSEGRFDRAYIVVGGGGWSLKEWYLSGALKEYLEYDGLVEIVSLDDFITLANKKKL
jgi:hypothetical protein